MTTAIEELPSRAEHLQWCKDRALELLDAGELQQAFTSMCSDLSKHPQTAHHHSTNALGMELLIIGSLDTPEEMRKWINGYN